VGIAIEFMTLMVPMLLMQTELLPYVRGPLILLMEMLIFASVVPNNTTPTQDDDNNRRPAFLSIHRSSVYILTTIAILAVDFPIFPRRFCKTEVGGYGWMDLGAASFIIIAGLTSAASSSSYGDASTSNQTPVKSIASWKRAMKKCTPLIVIGFVRLATNKGLEYQEHVSEYGVHWNFFFTLCFVEGFMVLWRSRKNSLGNTFSPYHLTGLWQLC
jgi:phosphatidylinositol glycan class W